MINQAHRLRLALEQYMRIRGFDLHGPNTVRTIDDICLELDIEIDTYVELQKQGKLNY